MLRRHHRVVIGGTNRRASPEVQPRLTLSQDLLTRSAKDPNDPPFSTVRGGDMMLREGHPPVLRPVNRGQRKHALDIQKHDAVEQQKVRTKPSGLMAGHTEAVIGRVKEYLGKRSVEHLISAFRKFDKDASGALEMEEFQKFVRELNVGLTDKDAAAIFRMVDADGSGSLEMDEFFLNLRHDTFPRPHFLGPKAERGALGKMQRVELAKSLVREGEQASLLKVSTDKALEIIQEKCDQVLPLSNRTFSHLPTHSTPPQSAGSLSLFRRQPGSRPLLVSWGTRARSSVASTRTKVAPSTPASSRLL